MAETAMALADTDLERIGTYVKGNLYGWFVEVAPHLVIGPQLLERTATIEQELKDQRELMAVRFDAMDLSVRGDERSASRNGMRWTGDPTSGSRRWTGGSRI